MCYHTYTEKSGQIILFLHEGNNTSNTLVTGRTEAVWQREFKDLSARPCMVELGGHKEGHSPGGSVGISHIPLASFWFTFSKLHGRGVKRPESYYLFNSQLSNTVIP
jgi:hypothetical protein